MNHKLVLGLIIVGGIAFGGCQKVNGPAAQTNPTESPKTAAVATKEPAVSPVSDEESVKNMENEIKQLDTAKDFPDFSQTDLQ